MTTPNPGDNPEQPDTLLPQAVVGLGSGNQFGDVNIDTVAGRDAITVHVHLPPSEDNTVSNTAKVKDTSLKASQPTMQVSSLFKLSVHPVIAEFCAIPLVAWIGSTLLGFVIWNGTVNLVKIDNAYTTFLGVMFTVLLQWLALRDKIPFAWTWIALHAILWSGAILLQAEAIFYKTYLVPYLLFGGLVFMLTNGRFVKVSNAS